jgi:hypothetical protein
LLAAVFCLPGDPELVSITHTPAPTITPTTTPLPSPTPILTATPAPLPTPTLTLTATATALPTPTQIVNLQCPVIYSAPDGHDLCVVEVVSETAEYNADGVPSGVTFAPGDVLPIDLTLSEHGRCVLRASDRWVACGDVRYAPVNG